MFYFSIARAFSVFIVVAALEAQKELGFEQKDIDDIRSMITDTSINYLILILIATVTHTVLEVASVKSSYVFWRDNESLEGLSLIYVLGDFFSQGEVGDRVRVRASPRSLGTRCRSGRTQADRSRSFAPSCFAHSCSAHSCSTHSCFAHSLTLPPFPRRLASVLNQRRFFDIRDFPFLPLPPLGRLEVREMPRLLNIPPRP